MTDDNYFACGLAEVLNGAGEVSTNINLNGMANAFFYSYDIIILALNNYVLTLKTLKRLSLFKVKVIVFLEVRKAFDITMIGEWGICSKKATPKQIMQSLTMKNHNDIKKLSAYEFALIESFSQGRTAGAISRELNIPVKTLSAHKLNALKRLGLGSIPPLFGLVFISIFKRNQMSSLHI